eukprot:687871-Rhodomonas_salina.1
MAASCCTSNSHSSHAITLACVICQPPSAWLTCMSVRDTPFGSSIAARCADHHLLVISLPVALVTTAIPAVYLNISTTDISITILVLCADSSPKRILLTALLVLSSTARFSSAHVATTSNANKALNGFNGALKSLGTQAVGAKNWYDRAVSDNVIPQTEIGNNIANVVSTIKKLN